MTTADNRTKYLILIYQLMTLALVVFSLRPLLAQQSSVSSTSQAQGTSTASASQSTQTQEIQKSFSAVIALERSSNLFTNESGNRESSTDLSLTPSYKITSKLSTSANAVISRQETGNKDTTISNTTLVLGYTGYKFENGAQLAHSLRGVIPTNEEIKKRDRLNTAVGIRNQISHSIGAFDMGYKLTLTRNFHEFTVNAEGSANVEYSLSHILELAYNFNDKISISQVGTIRQGRTYGGFNRTSFSADTDLNYYASKSLAINIGASTEGSAFKANGTDSNIELFNENKSLIRAGLSFSY